MVKREEKLKKRVVHCKTAGIGASIKTVGGLVDAGTVHLMTFGGLVGISTIPIALLPKVINRIKSKPGITVNPTDDPSLLRGKMGQNM